MCMQCVAQASPMIAVTFGVLRRDTLSARARAVLSVSRIPVVSRWATTAPSSTRRDKVLARAERRRRPEALAPPDRPGVGAGAVR